MPLSDSGKRAHAGAEPDRFEDIFVAASAVALGLFVLAGSFSIDLGSGYDCIGPRFFPYVVACGLVASGGLLVRGALRRKKSAHDSPSAHMGLSSIVTLSLALGLSAIVLERGGFILTSTVLFWLVARAFASKRPWRDAVSGLMLSVVVYLAFTRGLGLVLPQGILAGLF